MINWKTDRRVHFAVGLAIVFVAAKWLFTGSLFYAAVDMTAKPGDGQTSAGVTFSALLPVVFDLLIGGIIFIGGYAINLAEIVFGRVKSLLDPETGQLVQVPQSSSSPSTPSAVDTPQAVSLDSPASMKRAVDQLGDAAAVNDLELLEKLRKQIRKPYAMAALTEAYSRGDTEAAAVLVDELNKMLDTPVQSKRKGSGASNA